MQYIITWWVAAVYKNVHEPHKGDIFSPPGMACVLQPPTCGLPSSSRKLKFDFCKCIEHFSGLPCRIKCH